MKDERVPPHNNGDGVVPIGQTVGGSEKAFGLREDPNAKRKQQVDKVAKVGEKVVHAATVIGEDADGHKVDQLRRVPDVEVFREAAHEIAANEDVHNAANERYLLTE